MTAARSPAPPVSGLSALAPFDDDGCLRAVIEAPRGSANKLKYDPALGAFQLHRVLPPGMSFPFDFGFVPGTLGEDGDPLDVLVLMDEPTLPGVVVPCRLVAVIEATQHPLAARHGSRGERNDRLLAIADKTHRHRGIAGLRDLDARLLDEIERFFVFYNEQHGVRFVPRGRASAAAARRLVSQGRQRLASYQG